MDTLWEVSFAGAEGEAEARALLTLASQLRDVTEGGLRKECEEHRARAARYLEAVSHGVEAAPEERPQSWPLEAKIALAAVIVAVVLAVALLHRSETWLDTQAEAGVPLPPDPMLWTYAAWFAAAAAAGAAVIVLRHRRPIGAWLSLLGATLGFVGVALTRTLAEEPLNWLANPTDRIYLAVVWLLVAVPLLAAALFALLGPHEEKDRSLQGYWLRMGRGQRWSWALSLAGAALAVSLAVFVGLRGEQWVQEASSVSPDSLSNPMATIAGLWGLAAVGVLTTAWLYLRARVVAACLGLGAVAMGFIGIALAHGLKDDYGRNAWLADPAHKGVLLYLWLMAAVPIVAAVVVTLVGWLPGHAGGSRDGA